MADPIGEARTAVEAAAVMAAASALDAGQKKKTPGVGPVRYNLEAFGVAILGAVLLKWFCIEAFQIPTSSMQPTLMGSFEAGVYDRLLVDKFSPVIREPQRWDVTVFGYPLQQNQNYVKRLIGLPGERLFIGGGNLHAVTGPDDARKHTTLRKPERIQGGMWKEVYPARLHLHPGQQVLGDDNSILWAIPGSAWTNDGDPDHIEVQLEPVPGRPYKLSFRDRIDGGFVDRVWDGYPTGTAAAIRERNGGQACEIVPDGRIEATFTPEQALEELALEIEVRRPGTRALTFALIVRDGKCQLVAQSEDGRSEKSAEKVCELPAGVGTGIGFAHLDDELIAWRDGDEVLRLDVAAFDCRDGCELPDGKGITSTDHSVTPQLRCKGRGKLTISELRICRDLHYTKRGFPHAQGLIEVPAGHYFMMGDNTLQSIDSRGWLGVDIGVLPDGTVVEPTLAAPRGGRVLRGNKRPMPSQAPPDRDETPVIIGSREMMAMIDAFGDVHALAARASLQDGRFEIAGAPGVEGSGNWVPQETWVPFVPREHIRGRALVIFWRWPLPRFTLIR